ncbi:MAG: PAS domain S-box protein [Magnetococcales bacterium]|nr:PAS domain S-box protein [Magnetococcales bacterium]
MAINTWFTIVDHQDVIVETYHYQISEELAFIGRLIRDAVVRGDDVNVNETLVLWGAARHEIVYIVLRPSNSDFPTVSYRREGPFQRMQVHQEIISMNGRELFQLELGHDLDAIDHAVHNVETEMGLLTFLWTGTIGLVLWLVLRVLATRPLEQEILRRELVERTLLQAQKDHHIIFESVGAMIWFLDDTFHIRQANRLAAALTGHEPEEVIGKTAMDLFPGAFAEKFHADNQKIMETALPLMDIIESGPVLSGEIHWFRTDKVPYLDDDGRVVGITVISKDISDLKHMEARVRESEERYRQLFENSPDGLLIADFETQLIEVGNQRMASLLGYNSNKLPGLGVKDISQKFIELQETLERLAQLGHLQIPLIEIQKKDGGVLPVELTMWTFWEHERMKFTGRFRDISRRLAIEETIRALNYRHELILGAAGEGIHGLDRMGVTTFVNPAAARMLGRMEQELVGRDSHDLIHHSQPDGSPYSRERCPILTTIRDGRVRHVSDEVFLRGDGTSFPVEYVVSPIMEQGEIAGAVIVFRDISERLEMERALRASQERFKRLSDSAFEGIAIIEDGIIRDGNTAFATLFGCELDEMKGTHFLQWTAPEDREKVEEYARNGYTQPYEIVGLRNNGTSIFLEMHGSDTQQDGKTVRIIAMRDITARKQGEADLKEAHEALRIAKEAAEEANRAKSRFLAAMSHDIRTPMNAVLGMGELLADSGLNDTQRGYLNTLNRAGETLLALINDILDLSKIEADQLKLEVIPFNLHDLASGILEIFSLGVHEKGLNLVLEMDTAKGWIVLGDRDRLRQVLMNLIANAIKFTESGSVIVSVRRGEGGFVNFQVIDTGIGIPEDKLESIFDPFCQGERSITRRYGGTGLGLTICHRLVQLMGGTIRVESQPGVGSRFYFSVHLPVTEPGSFQKRLPCLESYHVLNPISNVSSNDGLKILLADDAEDNRIVIEAFLSQTNHRLTLVENGQMALERFQEAAFDLVLMDIEMPVMDGLTATRNIRSWELIEGQPRTPIIALTAHAMKEESQRILEAGCDFHLTKPIRKKKLLNLLHCLIKGDRLEKGADDDDVLPQMKSDNCLLLIS